MIVARDISQPIRNGLSWEQTWRSEDEGLIRCWENGRLLALSPAGDADSISVRVARGELPSLHWKGGFEIDPDDPDKKPKMKKKYGCLQYLATLQGIRQQSLRIDTDAEEVFVCSRTGVRVIFTSDRNRWAAGEAGGD